MTIQISPFNQEHATAIATLLNEKYKETYEFIPFDGKTVLSHIRKHGLKILVAEERGKLRGLIGTHPEEHSEESIHWLAAQNGNDHASIENMLVKEVEKNAKRGIVSTMVDEGSSRTNEWIDRGYVLQPGFQRMSAKLNILRPIPEVAENIKIRSLGAGEEEKLVAVINAGFGWQRLEPGTLKAWKTEEPPFSEEWVQVAEVNATFVSAVVARPDTDYARYFGLKRGYLGPAATLPDFRNKHLASALTAQAMNFLFRQGMESVRLGTSEENASSIALLTSLGFQVDNVRKILRKQLGNA